MLSVLAMPAVAAATAEPEPAGEAPAVEEFGDVEPAVILEGPAVTEEDPAWTFRFLVPTILVMAVLAVVVTGLVYALRIRGRYRIVP
jgi:hypothetical protein